jgi:hypothetical protein
VFTPLAWAGIFCGIMFDGFAVFMKVLLKSKTTGLFFISEGTWTGSRADARDFETCAAAIWSTHQCHLGDVDIVFAFGARVGEGCVSIRGNEIFSRVEQEGELGFGQGQRV